MRMYHILAYVYRKNKRIVWKYSALFGALIFLLYCLITLPYPRPYMIDIKYVEATACYRVAGKETLPDISNINPREEKSIFFHDTSCRSFFMDKITVTARQACAVEAAAKMNPNFDVYLLFNSPGVIKLQGDESDYILEALMSYENVNIMYLDVNQFTKGTFFEYLYNTADLDMFGHVLARVSDVLRYLTLWKYGGIGIDSDMLVTRSLEDLPANFAGIESKFRIGSAIMGFDSRGLGHTLLESYLNFTAHKFKSLNWDSIRGRIGALRGAHLLSRLLNHTCKIRGTENKEKVICNGVTLLPRHKFYSKYIEENHLEEFLNLTKHSYTVRIWNSKNKESTLPITSKDPCIYFGKKYCPKVFHACNKEF